MFAPKTDSIRLFVGGGVRRSGKGLCIVWITDKNFSVFIGRRRFFGRPAAPFGGFFVPCIGVAVFRAVVRGGRVFCAAVRIYFFMVDLPLFFSTSWFAHRC